MLRVEGAVVQFGDRRALDHVDLAVGPGETIAVLGPSGSGKTTLLRAVAGLQRLGEGCIRWDGDDLAGVAAHERHFGLMFQEYALFPHRDVAGNVEFGLRMTSSDRAARARRVDEVLELVGLTGLRARSVASLSGGEQQRVALARALAVSPRLLMLDEPLGALDRVWRRRLLTEIRAILDRAALPALYVTHDHEEAFAIATRVAIMRDGRVVQVGAPPRCGARRSTHGRPRSSASGRSSRPRCATVRCTRRGGRSRPGPKPRRARSKRSCDRTGHASTMRGRFTRPSFARCSPVRASSSRLFPGRARP